MHAKQIADKLSVVTVLSLPITDHYAEYLSLYHWALFDGTPRECNGAGATCAFSSRPQPSPLLKGEPQMVAYPLRSMDLFVETVPIPPKYVAISSVTLRPTWDAIEAAFDDGAKSVDATLIPCDGALMIVLDKPPVSNKTAGNT